METVMTKTDDADVAHDPMLVMSLLMVLGEEITGSKAENTHCLDIPLPLG